MADQNQVVLKHKQGQDLEAHGETQLLFKPDPKNYFTLHFNKWCYTFDADGKLLYSMDVENTVCGKSEIVLDNSGSVSASKKAYGVDSLDKEWATRFKAKPVYLNKETGKLSVLFNPDTMIPIADENNVVTGTSKT